MSQRERRPSAHLKSILCRPPATRARPQSQGCAGLPVLQPLRRTAPPRPAGNSDGGGGTPRRRSRRGRASLLGLYPERRGVGLLAGLVARRTPRQNVSAPSGAPGVDSQRPRENPPLGIGSGAPAPAGLAPLRYAHPSRRSQRLESDGQGPCRADGGGVVAAPIWEADRHPHSYACRPQRNAHQAMDALSQALRRGRKTANGEKFSNKDMTCAHRKLPFGTMVRVTNLENDSSVVLRVNDRGPYSKGRIVDVSRLAAKKLDFIRSGTATVRVDVIIDSALIADPVLAVEELIEEMILDTGSYSFVSFEPKTEASMQQKFGVWLHTMENESRAYKEAAKLSKSYATPVFVKENETEEAKSYSIYIGRFSSKTEAEAFVRKIRILHPDCKVMQYGTL